MSKRRTGTPWAHVPERLRGTLRVWRKRDGEWRVARTTRDVPIPPARELPRAAVGEWLAEKSQHPLFIAAGPAVLDDFRANRPKE